jgi:hypothetical protein
MDKDDWRRTWSALGTTCSRLEAGTALQAVVGATAVVRHQQGQGPLLNASVCCNSADVAKHVDGPLLKGVLDAGDQQNHANSFKHVTDARQQLVELQQLVGVGGLNPGRL